VTWADKDIDALGDRVVAPDIVHDDGGTMDCHLYEEDCDFPIPEVVDNLRSSMVFHMAVAALDTLVVAASYFDDRLDTCSSVIR
jgi:hypothetical protein